MDKIETIERVVEERIHRFYCDDCGKFLGKSTEWDDGYYEEIGNFSTHYGCHYIKKHLCDKCKDEFVSKLNQALTNLGFKK